VIEFGDWPNYVTAFDWPGNIARIFASTPSVSDAIEIARQEWLFEIGYLNMAFGHGISEWSLTLIPEKMLVILAMGMILATLWAVSAFRPAACSVGERAGRAAATGLGAGFVALTGATLSWVVCCAYPSWIVGLTMLGLSVATANWLEPLGLWINLAGFSLLTATLLVTARRMDTELAEARARSAEPRRFHYTPATQYPIGGPGC
jgi:hypothetical protein